MDIVVGLQGSGKSYRVVDYIKKNSNLYYKMFNNIDEFNHGYFDNSYLLKMSEFVEDLTVAFAIKEKNHGDFKKSFEYLSDKGWIKEDQKTLIVIDEAQDYFSKKSDVLSFLVTQHRHFNFDLTLMTQSEQLIHSDFRLFNILAEAIPPSKKFNKNVFVYKLYTAKRNKDALFSSQKMRVDPEVFKLYHSGDFVVSPFIYKKALIMLFFVLIFVFYGFYHVLNMDDKYSDNVVVDDNRTASILKDVKVVDKKPIEPEFPNFLEVHVYGSECYFVDFLQNKRSGFLSSSFCLNLINDKKSSKFFSRDKSGGFFVSKFTKSFYSSIKFFSFCVFSDEGCKKKNQKKEKGEKDEE